MKYMKLLLTIGVVVSLSPPVLANTINAIGVPLDINNSPNNSIDGVGGFLDGQYTELGTGNVFEPVAQIGVGASTWTGGAVSSQTPTPAGGEISGSVLLSITNTTGLAWQDLYYVADTETHISNRDLFVANADSPSGVGWAFKIDATGSNQPLQTESGRSLANIFEVNEVWEFVLQDYGNIDFYWGSIEATPDNLSSIGISGASLFDPSFSTGSIIALPYSPIPEPTTMAFIGVTALGLFVRKRFMI